MKPCLFLIVGILALYTKLSKCEQSCSPTPLLSYYYDDHENYDQDLMASNWNNSYNKATYYSTLSQFNSTSVTTTILNGTTIGLFNGNYTI